MSEENVREWGAGPPVILVHGSGDTDPEMVWQHQRPLAAHYTLLVVTRPGYGARPVAPRDDVAQDARELVALLESLGGAHLVGYSYGGCIAMIAAAMRPGLVWSLAVVEPPAFAVARGNPDVEALIERLKHAYEPERPLATDEFLVRFLRCLDPSFPNSITLSLENRKGIEAMRAEPAPWALDIPLDALATTTFPKLVVSGNWSPAFEAVADVLTARLPAQRVLIEGAGHYILDTGAQFNREQLPFLGSATPPLPSPPQAAPRDQGR